jgi:drug/metabolite transporter (DMT)-like permease
MLAAGTMNLVGFLLVTRASQRTSAVCVNVVTNGITNALTILAGIMIFAEPWNRDLGFGILLSLAGILTISLAGAAKNGAPATDE